MIIGVDARPLAEKQKSGVPEYCQRLLEEIIKQDKDNEYRLFLNSFKADQAVEEEWKTKGARISARRYPNKFLNFSLKFFSYPRLDRLTNANIFFLPHMNFAAFSKKAKVIFTAHDLSFLRYPEFFNSKRRLWHKFVNIKKITDRADKIVAVSENTRRDLIDILGVKEEKIKLIYSGLNREFSQAADAGALAIIKKKYDLPDKFIFSIGTIEPRKNITGLIRAYEDLRRRRRDLSVSLVIAGGQDWGLKPRSVFSEARQSSYRQDIRFIGYVEAPERACLYRLASVFAYPSFYEGFGFPPLEAMAAGAPVITSPCSSLPEIAGKAAWFANPYDIADISLALEKVLTNQALSNDLQIKGVRQAEKFSWEKTAREYIKLFNEV